MFKLSRNRITFLVGIGLIVSFLSLTICTLLAIDFSAKFEGDNIFLLIFAVICLLAVVISYIKVVRPTGINPVKILIGPKSDS